MENKSVATTVKSDIKSLILSDQMKKQFALALPKHLTPDRFVRIALTAINKNPKLLSCTKESLLACLLDCSQLGIEPDNRNAHLIPYGDKCTLIIDYKGIVALARRSGEIADIHADVVYENDDFSYSFGTAGNLIHKPAMKTKGKPIAAYSYVRLKDGSSSYEVMNVEEIEDIHKRSKAGNSGPWVTDWAEMAKKTVFRRHSKWLPVSSEFQEAIEKDYDVPIDITSGSIIDNPKADVKMPEALTQEPEPEQEELDKIADESFQKEPEQKPNPDIIAFKAMMISFDKAKKVLGDVMYYKILSENGVRHAKDICSLELMQTILDKMSMVANVRANGNKKK